MLTFVVPVVLLSRQPHFALAQVWYLSVATVTLQALTSLTLLGRAFRRQLGSPVVRGEEEASASAAAPGVSPGAARSN
jgi:hypothetical protein